MKKIYIALALLLGINSVNHAQESVFVLNGEMETWGSFIGEPQAPTGWLTANILAALDPSSPTSVFQVGGGNQYAGNFSARIETVDLSNNNPLQGMIPDTAGFMILGEINPITQVVNQGYAFTNSPESFEFYAKYSPSGSDYATATAILSRWNTSTNSQDVIAVADIEINSSVTDYQLFSVNFDYVMPGVTPDTAAVILSSSSTVNPELGSALTIDNIAFVGGDIEDTGVSIEDIILANKGISFFPNPASEIITFQANEHVQSIAIFTIEGKLVTTIGINGNKVNEINVADWNNGIYLFRCMNQNNAVIETGKFVVAH
jgi:hypothetical protein